MPYKGYEQTVEHKKKHSKAISGQKHYLFGKSRSEETKKKISQNHANMKGKNNPMYGIGLNGKKNGMFGKQQSKETKLKISISQKKRWKKNRKKLSKIVINNLKIRPTKPEKIIKSILRKLKLTIYKYTGDRKIGISGFYPDFINKKDNKIIEVYGDYWHTRKEWMERDKRRLISYKECGYKTLIIWEHQLNNIDKVITQILKFNKT